MFSGEDGSGMTGNVVANPQPSPSQPSQPSGDPGSASADDDAVLGNENAPVTMIEFSDYQCGFCARFWSQTLPQIKKEYIGTSRR